MIDETTGSVDEVTPGEVSVPEDVALPEDTALPDDVALPEDTALPEDIVSSDDGAVPPAQPNEATADATEAETGGPTLDDQPQGTTEEPAAPAEPSGP